MSKVIAVLALDGSSSKQEKLALSMLFNMEPCIVHIGATPGLEEEILSINKHTFKAFLPWDGYNKEISDRCSECFSWHHVNAVQKFRGLDLCERLYSKYESLPIGARKLRARISLILEGVQEVYVFKAFRRGGNSELAILMAKELGIDVTIIER